jgi:predicted RNA binding protein YcfA (HicA-like mRNA interferase family)
VKIPRDCTGPDLVRALRRFGYSVSRQPGSHIVMTTVRDGEHHVTIPNHRPIKIGTMHEILKNVATHHHVTVAELLRQLDI